MTAFGCFSEVGVALGHGGRSSLLPLALVAVETRRKVILGKGLATSLTLEPTILIISPDH
jgi:hypothetical protein